MGRHRGRRTVAGNQSRGEEPDHQQDENSDSNDVGNVQAGFLVMLNWQQIPRMEI